MGGNPRRPCIRTKDGPDEVDGRTTVAVYRGPLGDDMNLLPTLACPNYGPTKPVDLLAEADKFLEQRVEPLYRRWEEETGVLFTDRQLREAAFRAELC